MQKMKITYFHAGVVFSNTKNGGPFFLLTLEVYLDTYLMTDTYLLLEILGLEKISIEKYF